MLPTPTSIPFVPQPLLENTESYGTLFDAGSQDTDEPAPPLQRESLPCHLRGYEEVNTTSFDRTDDLYLGTKAVGVAYVSPRNYNNAGGAKETIIMARKLVVLGSGTLGTPQVIPFLV